jgi:hypothetical protein
MSTSCQSDVWYYPHRGERQREFVAIELVMGGRRRERGANTGAGQRRQQRAVELRVG